MAIDMLKKAIVYTLRGDFGKVGRGAIKKIVSQPDTIKSVSEVNTSAWLTSSQRSYAYQLTETDYSNILTESGSELTVEFAEGMQAIELPIASVDMADNITIQRKNGEPDETEDKYRIRVDSSYEYPPIIWRTLNVGQGTQSVNIQINMKRKTPQMGLIPKLNWKRKHPNSFTDPSKSEDEEVDRTMVGHPAVVPDKTHPPIFMISIDAVRYDHRDKLTSIIDELGSDSIIPSEPRTQGTWTPPSHGSMFTGAHPGQHGYVGYGKGSGDKRPINPKLTTIPEILIDTGYKCSGLVSHSRILPEFGFGRGFHRFRHDGMSYPDWVTRESDSKASVNQLMDWIEKDLTVRNHSLFYFLHVFDPHYPYLPPIELLDSADLDFSKSKRYQNQIDKAKGENWSYLDGYNENQEVDPDLVTDMKDWYSKSIEYVDTQIARLLRYLKDKNLFDKSLVIITGDHGEEFGERGFFTHTSLYDENIRPFMAIKPPADVSWSHKDKVDTIDFLPTIARLIDKKVPEYCDGTPIQSEGDDNLRFTERIYPDYYNLAVEMDDIKGIFTYESGYPDRPNKVAIENGPKLEEFYQLSKVRLADYSDSNISSSQKQELRQLAEEFLLSDSITYDSHAVARKPSQETMQQLQDLGYK